MRQPVSLNPKEDHFKFLIVFFTKYLFCFHGKECTLRFVPLVRHLLESDNPIALGPLVLASICKGLHQLTTETPGELHSSASGPLWLVQIWLMASLPELTRIWPQNFRPDSSTSYGYQFVLPLLAQGVCTSLDALFHLINRNPADIAFSGTSLGCSINAEDWWCRRSSRLFPHDWRQAVDAIKLTELPASLAIPGPSPNPQASLHLDPPVVNLEYSNEEASKSSGEPLPRRKNQSRSTPAATLFREADFPPMGAPQLSSSPRSGSSETGETFGDDVSSSFPGHSFLPKEIPSAATLGASHFQASVVELPAVSGSSHHAPVPIFPSTADVSRDLIISEDTSWGWRNTCSASGFIGSGPSGLSKLWGSPDYWGQHPTGRISTSPAAALDSSGLPAEVLPNPSPGLVNSSGSFSFPALSPTVSEPGNIGEFFSVNSPSPVVPFSSVGPSTDVAVLTALSNRESSAGDDSHAPTGDRTINRAAADHSTGGSAQVPVPLHIDELNLQRLVSTLLDSLRDPAVVAEIRAVCTCLLAPPSPLGQDLHARSS
ncbi:hypothetical protein Tsubulata_048155 [Turnera subulata]|uniref:Aminotransferase-like plant mobile domain-containing protein n=1 Tax=Turnera subulata TaxID=218843 RepID=A0A9Q0FGH1_9ROSI|nr:hypothetical protein Tsubulata_048155 [Turnera subulata]